MKLRNEMHVWIRHIKATISYGWRRGYIFGFILLFFFWTWQGYHEQQQAQLDKPIISDSLGSFCNSVYAEARCGDDSECREAEFENCIQKIKNKGGV